MKDDSSKIILFITGAFVSSACWDNWRTYFENNGYKTFAPAWPSKESPAEILRNNQPDKNIASNRLAGLTLYFENFIKGLPAKPILIGHSIGGLIAQMLVNRGLAEAGIAIHSLAPLGVFTFKLSFYKAGWGPLGFFTPVDHSFLMSFKQWQYAFTNGMQMEEQVSSYYRLVTPESKRLVRDGISKAAKVDFTKPHVPLLFIAGTTDNFIPASLNLSNYKRYTDRASVTDYKEFPRRNHYVLGQSTWKEDAGFILSWMNQKL